MLLNPNNYKRFAALIVLLAVVLIVGSCVPQRRPVQPDRTPNETREFDEPPKVEDNRNIDRMKGGNNRVQNIKRAVEEVKYVKSASVIITGNTAIVGVNMSPGVEDRVTSRVKKEVEDRVRRTDRTIDNVAVTSDPDLVARIERIAEKISQGKPVTAFTTEITEILRRIAPVE